MRRPAADDRGETLLELVVTIAILGVCVVAIGAGIALSVKISSIHRDQSVAEAFLHNYAEALQNSYAPCAAGVAPDYVALGGLSAPAGFAPPTATVRFWAASPPPGSFASSACPATDPGLQRVTLTLNSNDGFVTESLVVVLRKAMT